MYILFYRWEFDLFKRKKNIWSSLATTLCFQMIKPDSWKNCTEQDFFFKKKYVLKLFIRMFEWIYAACTESSKVWKVNCGVSCFIQNARIDVIMHFEGSCIWLSIHQIPIAYYILTAFAWIDFFKIELQILSI